MAGGGERAKGRARGGRTPVNAAGKALGPRAIATRERLMRAAADLLRERGALDLPVIEIARRAQTSRAAFYEYFRDLDEVALALAERAAEEMPPLLPLIEGNWAGAAGLARARAIADAFLAHWDAHHAVLHLRNLAVERGDRRFLRVRLLGIGPILEALARQLGKGQAEGRVSRALHPVAAAAALAAFLERLAAHRRELGHLGVTRDHIRETSARILFQTLTGKPPPG